MEIIHFLIIVIFVSLVSAGLLKILSEAENHLAKIFKFSSSGNIRFWPMFFVSLIILIISYVVGILSIELWSLITFISSLVLVLLDKDTLKSFFPFSKVDESKLNLIKIGYLGFIPIAYLSFFIFFKPIENVKIESQNYNNRVELVKKIGNEIEKLKDDEDVSISYNKSKKIFEMSISSRQKTEDLRYVLFGMRKLLIALSIYGIFFLIVIVLNSFQVIPESFFKMIGIDNMVQFRGRWDLIHNEMVQESTSIYIDSKKLYDNFTYIDLPSDKKTNYLLNKKRKDFFIITENGECHIKYKSDDDKLILKINNQDYYFQKYRPLKDRKNRKNIRIKLKKLETMKGNKYYLVSNSLFLKGTEYNIKSDYIIEDSGIYKHNNEIKLDVTPNGNEIIEYKELQYKLEN